MTGKFQFLALCLSGIYDLCKSYQHFYISLITFCWIHTLYCIFEWEEDREEFYHCIPESSSLQSNIQRFSKKYTLKRITFFTFYFHMLLYSYWSAWKQSPCSLLSLKHFFHFIKKRYIFTHPELYIGTCFSIKSSRHPKLVLRQEKSLKTGSFCISCGF